MIALDTNIVVRLIVADDRSQLARARALVETSPVLLLTTVVLETEWVLRKTYGLSRQHVREAMALFCGLPGVQLESPDVVEAALDLHAKGFDFADAIHIASLPSQTSLATFDKALVKLSKKHFDNDLVKEPGE